MARTKTPPSMDLFQQHDDTAAAEKDKQILLGKRLTAQFQAPISAQENADKLKKREIMQDNFFAPLADDPQNKLFLKDMNEPVPMSEEFPGKVDVEKAIGAANMRIYTAGGKAPRVYLDQAAKTLIVSFGKVAGIFGRGERWNDWTGLAMKPSWLSMIAREMRDTWQINGVTLSQPKAKKLESMAQKLDDLAVSPEGRDGVSFIDAAKGFSEIKSIVHHETSHIDQFAVEPTSNYKPAELFGADNLRSLHDDQTYVKAAGNLLLRGYGLQDIPMEIMAYTAGAQLDKDGNVAGLGITPTEARDLYVKLVKAAVDTKGEEAYNLIRNAKSTFKRSVHGLIGIAVEDSGANQPQHGQVSGSLSSGRDGSTGQSNRQGIPRTKRPPGQP